MTTREISGKTINKIQPKETELDSTQTEKQTRTRKLRKVRTKITWTDFLISAFVKLSCLKKRQRKPLKKS